MVVPAVVPLSLSLSLSPLSPSPPLILSTQHTQTHTHTHTLSLSPKDPESIGFKESNMRRGGVLISVWKKTRRTQEDTGRCSLSYPLARDEIPTACLARENLYVLLGCELRVAEREAVRVRVGNGDEESGTPRETERVG